MSGAVEGITLRVALFGCGPRGLEHAEAVAATSGFTLTGVVDPDAARRDEAARRFHIPSHADAASLIAEGPADVYILATPPQPRVSIARKILDHTRPRAIVLEKPASLRLAEVEDLAEACREKGVLLTVSHQLRFAPEFVALRQSVETGELGCLEFLRGVCHGNLMDQGLHLIDMMVWLAGGRKLLWVSAQATGDREAVARYGGGEGAAPAPHHPSPLWTAVTLGFEGGLRGMIESGPLAPRSRSFLSPWLQKRVTAVGTLGSAESQSASHFRIHTAQGAREQIENIETYRGATAAFYAELAGSLVNGSRHRCEAAGAIVSLEAALAAIQSVLDGGIVPLPVSRARDPIAELESPRSGSMPAMRAGEPQAVPREAAGEIQVSVIIPSPDHRGHLLEAVRSWTLGQDCAPGAFEVVVVSDGTDEALEDQVRESLRANDQLLLRRSPNETLLYDVGVRSARGRWILLTEPHVLAEEDCLGEVLRFIATHDFDGGCLRSLSIVPNRLARLEEMLFEEGFRDFRRPGDWRKVILRGTLLRRDVYFEAGGFEYSYGRFAEWALAARLHHTGRRMGYIAGAGVRHAYTSEFKGFLPAVIEFTEGEFAYRLDHPADYCARYFGSPRAWLARTRLNPGASRALRGALLRSMAGWFWWPRLAASYAPVLARHLLPPRVAGRIRAGGESLRLRLAMAATLFWTLVPKWQEKAYRSVWDRATEWARLRFIASRGWKASGAMNAPGLFPIENVPEEDLAGFHGIETNHGVRFRWTGGAAALYLALNGGVPRVVRLDTGGAGGVPGCLRCYYAGRRIPVTIDGTSVRLELPFHALGPDWLVLLCYPARPWTKGSPDRRELGLPVAAIRIE